MTDVTEQRINLQAEETDYKSAVSEALLTRMAAAVNFVNKRQYDTKQFDLNGFVLKFGPGKNFSNIRRIVFQPAEKEQE